MKDPPPVFSPASQSVTLPSLKSGWRFIKRETEQANKTTDRPFLPTLLSQDRGRERNSSVVHFFFFFSLLSAKERKLFLMNTENETKEKERKKELKFIQRYYEMHRRRSPWINPCSRSFTADRSRMNGVVSTKREREELLERRVETRRENMACERISKCAAYNRTLVNPD